MQRCKRARKWVTLWASFGEQEDADDDDEVVDARRERMHLRTADQIGDAPTLQIAEDSVEKGHTASQERNSVRTAAQIIKVFVSRTQEKALEAAKGLQHEREENVKTVFVDTPVPQNQ